MEVQFFGANCVRISTKKANIVIDDNLSQLGTKTVTKKEDIILKTFSFEHTEKDSKIVLDTPGEFEVSNISIVGIGARAHMDEEKTFNNTIFKIVASDIRLVVVGHIYPDLNEEQLESLGTVDVLVVPVGGHGYTLDGVGASKLIKNIEPKIVIPTHYANSSLSYVVPQLSLDDALKELPFEAYESVEKLKLKSSELPEVTKLVAVGN